MSYGEILSRMDKQQKKFSQIYNRYINKIYRFIYLKVNSEEKAQDLCSETFLRAWNVFRGDPKKVKNQQAFLYKIARNLIIDHYRDKARTQIISADSVPIIDPQANIEQDNLKKSDMERVKNALAGIKDDYQEIIIWRYVEDLSIPEIAQILGKSEGAVRVTIHRALNAIRDKIEEA